MRLLIASLSLALLSSIAHAAPAAASAAASATLMNDSVTPGTCATKAADKKLAGAAKNSFIKKCHKDAKAAAAAVCATTATDKKLAGAAKNSFVKKCEKDAAAAV